MKARYSVKALTLQARRFDCKPPSFLKQRDAAELLQPISSHLGTGFESGLPLVA